MTWTRRFHGMIINGNIKWGIYIILYKNAGWWFVTCLIFPYIGNVIIPTDELIFFRGVETTNQFVYIYIYVQYML